MRLDVTDVADSHFLLANARIVEFPVVYCNEGLCQLTGFERSELTQKPAVCSMMHGELTSPELIARLEDAMEKQIADQFEIQLYKKNSTYRFECNSSLVAHNALIICIAIESYAVCTPRYTMAIVHCGRKPIGSRVGRVASGVCVCFVCLIFHTMSQKPTQLGSPNFILGSKGQRSRSRCRGTKNVYRHGLLRSCECWLFLVKCLLSLSQLAL